MLSLISVCSLLLNTAQSRIPTQKKARHTQGCCQWRITTGRIIQTTPSPCLSPLLSLSLSLSLLSPSCIDLPATRLSISLSLSLSLYTEDNQPWGTHKASHGMKMCGHQLLWVFLRIRKEELSAREAARSSARAAFFFFAE